MRIAATRNVAARVVLALILHLMIGAAVRFTRFSAASQQIP